jgi:hypothetical protein
VVWATLKKYGLKVGNMKFNVWNKGCKSICTIMSNFICVFFHISCAIQNMLIAIGKMKKIANHDLA